MALWSNSHDSFLARDEATIIVEPVLSFPSRTELHRLEAGCFASRREVRLPDEQRPPAFCDFAPRYKAAARPPTEDYTAERSLLIVHSAAPLTYKKWSAKGEGFLIPGLDMNMAPCSSSHDCFLARHEATMIIERELSITAGLGAVMPRQAEDTPRTSWYLSYSKGCIDTTVALMLLVLTSPLIMLLMAMVRLTSRGPALYSQWRLGRGGAPYKIYKIRTMVHNCERTSGPRWSTPDDPRVTPLGRFLRRSHLDELPQLWNVLCGHMSLVGPRPERPEFVSQLERTIPNYRERLSVRPVSPGWRKSNCRPMRIGTV